MVLCADAGVGCGGSCAAIRFIQEATIHLSETLDSKYQNEKSKVSIEGTCQAAFFTSHFFNFHSSAPPAN
jgi:hypothetical protein